MLPYLVAGLTAGALGALEQYKRLKTPVTKVDYAWAWWVGRVVLEILIGLAAMLVLKKADASIVERFRPLGWFVVGAAGPAVARLRIIDVGSGDAPSPFGVATIYEPLRDWIAKQIDDIGAAAQTRNVKEVMLPLFNRTGVAPKEISDRYTIWMESSERFSTVQQLQEREYIKETLDGSEPAHVQRELLVLRALKLGAYRVLRDLRQSCHKGA